MVVLGVRKHDYVLLRIDPSLVDQSDKRYNTYFSKVFAFIVCVKIAHAIMETLYFRWKSMAILSFH